MAHMCHRMEKYIRRNIDGSLDEKGKERLQKHLQSCSDCRQYQASYLLLEEKLNRALAYEKVPNDFTDKVMANIRADQARTQERRSRVKPRIRRFGMVATAAAAALLLWQSSLGDPGQMGPEIAGRGDETGLEAAARQQDPGIGLEGEETSRPDPLLEDPVGPEGDKNPDGLGEDQSSPVTENEGQDPGGEAPGQATEDGQVDPIEGEDPDLLPEERQDVLDVDLDDQVRFEDKMRLASQDVLAPMGRILLKPVAVDEEAAFVAPRYQVNTGTLRYYVKASGEQAFSLAEKTEDGYEILSTSAVQDKASLVDTQNLDRTGLALRKGALYYKDKEIIPQIEELSLDYSLAGQGRILINVKSQSRDLKGLWITSLEGDKLRKISEAGGGRLLGLSPDGAWLAYSSASKDVYVSNLVTERTYLLAYGADLKASAHVHFHPSQNKLLLGGYIDDLDSVYELSLP